MTEPTAPTILIVDDEAPLRRVLERAVSARGYRVLTAGSAETAYDMLCAEQADAVLLDVSLPVMSGLAMYIAIVNRWPALAGRVAIMTGDPDSADVIAFQEHHGCTLIRKPFDLQEVFDWLAAVLRQRSREAGNG